MTAKRIADVLVVVGPSGSGKSTLINRLRKEFPSAFGYSVSHTTRPMRAGEVDKQSYHFTDNANFHELIDNKAFLEHAVVHDTYYGTSEASVRKVLDEDRVCLMDLDLVGAQALRKHPHLRSVIVFISPPDFGVLEVRLRDRGTETEEKILKRLSDGKEWVSWFEQNKSFFDFHLVNDRIDDAYAAFREGVMSRAFGEISVASGHSR